MSLTQSIYLAALRQHGLFPRVDALDHTIRRARVRWQVAYLRALWPVDPRD